MRADLRAVGNFPLSNDKFMVLVTTGRSSDTQFLSSHVGIGSRLHEEDGDFMMTSLTDSSDIDENSTSEKSHGLVSENFDESDIAESLRLFLIC